MRQKRDKYKHSDELVLRAIQMFHVDSASLSEISKATGIPRGTLCRYVHGDGSGSARRAYEAVAELERSKP